MNPTKESGLYDVCNHFGFISDGKSGYHLGGWRNDIEAVIEAYASNNIPQTPRKITEISCDKRL